MKFDIQDIIIKDCSTLLFLRYRDLQARVYKQENRHLTLLTVLDFEFLVCKRVCKQ